MAEILQARLEANGESSAAPNNAHAYDEIHRAMSGPPEKHSGTKGGDKSEPQGAVQKDGSKLYSFKLDHKSSGHAGSDAMVLLPKGFDPKKPVHLVVYNHGWYDTASSAVQHADLVKQMEKAPPNSVLLVPEWQEVPGSGLKGGLGGRQGTFASDGTFEAMVDDAFKKVPELRGNSTNYKNSPKVKGEPISQSTLDKIADISIISHSAGLNAVGSEIYKNDALSNKVSSITMLDSIYDAQQLQPWLRKNKADLESGAKRFTDIYGTSTRSESRTLERDAECILPSLTISYDTSNGSTPVKPSDLSEKPVVFRRTNIDHGTIPKVFVGVELAAEAELAKRHQGIADSF